MTAFNNGVCPRCGHKINQKETREGLFQADIHRRWVCYSCGWEQ